MPDDRNEWLLPVSFDEEHHSVDISYRRRVTAGGGDQLVDTHRQVLDELLHAHYVTGHGACQSVLADPEGNIFRLTTPRRPRSPDPAGRSALRAVGRHLRSCLDRTPPRTAFELTHVGKRGGTMVERLAWFRCAH